MKKLVFILGALFAIAAGIIAQNDEPEYELPEDCTSENDAVFYYDRGVGVYNAGDYETALLDFSCAVHLDNTYLDALHMRGLMFEKMDRPEEAYEAYAQVVEIDPEYEISYVGMGNAALKLEKYEEAVEQFSEYIDRNISNASIFYNRGLTYYKLEDYDAAIDDYTQAILLNPFYSDAYGGRANAHNGLGNYEAALGDIETAFNIELRDVAWMYLGQAQAYEGIGDVDSAREAYNLYLDIFPNLLPSIEQNLEDLNMCEVATSQNVNRRSNAGLEYNVLGVLAAGESAFADAKRTDSEGMSWWRLEDAAGWVRSDTVTETSGCSSVPAITE